MEFAQTKESRAVVVLLAGGSWWSMSCATSTHTQGRSKTSKTRGGWDGTHSLHSNWAAHAQRPSGNQAAHVYRQPSNQSVHVREPSFLWFSLGRDCFQVDCLLGVCAGGWCRRDGALGRLWAWMPVSLPVLLGGAAAALCRESLCCPNTVPTQPGSEASVWHPIPTWLPAVWSGCEW